MLECSLGWRMGTGTESYMYDTAERGAEFCAQNVPSIYDALVQHRGFGQDGIFQQSLYFVCFYRFFFK